MTLPRIATAVIGSACLVATAIVPSDGASHSTVAAPRRAAAAQIRVDQAGYLPGEPKIARLMTPAAVSGGSYVVVKTGGQVVLRGPIPDDSIGSWNANYGAVYRLNLSRLSKPGRYHVELRGTVHAQSPNFSITTRHAMFDTMLRYGVRFDQVQRDGHAVIKGTLNRKPSHLLDHHAKVYAWPTMQKGSDLILDNNLKRIGGPVDVEGGWFDAGDYLKFTHSSAYNDVLLFTSARLLGQASPPSVLREARYGLRWLGKMWDAKDKMLYLQVGVGSGNKAGTFRGDHDGWRLPEADDSDTSHLDRFVSHRPLFRAAQPGHLISPNLVGRVSAAFALAAQADAKTHPRRAARELHQAKLLYVRADLHPSKPLATALPHAFYPEGSWRDDMELGATEIALASHAVDGKVRPFVRDAANFGAAYIKRDSGDTLNLYDTGDLAHLELIRAMRTTGFAKGFDIGIAGLRAYVSGQLKAAEHKATTDLFGAAGTYDNFDVNSHTFGLIAVAGLFHHVTGSSRYDDFAAEQRNWLLGGNPWGVSAMVGIGSSFPHCMQQQVANLNGTTDGSAPVDLGAVVNGPNDAGIFDGGLGGFQDGMVHCSEPSYAAFDGNGSRYVDDVRSWQTDEPALDMTGAAVIAAAAQLSVKRR